MLRAADRLGLRCGANNGLALARSGCVRVPIANYKCRLVPLACLKAASDIRVAPKQSLENGAFLIKREPSRRNSGMAIIPSGVPC